MELRQDPLRAAQAVLALLDTSPAAPRPNASDTGDTTGPDLVREAHDDRRLYGALLVSQFMSDVALIRSVFYRLDGE